MQILVGKDHRHDTGYSRRRGDRNGGTGRSAGSGPQDVLKVTAYIVDVRNWPSLNKVYAEVMGQARPARVVVPVPALHYGYLIEIDAVAVRRKKEAS